MKQDIVIPCPFAQFPATTSPALRAKVSFAVELPQEFAKFGTDIFWAPLTLMDELTYPFAPVSQRDQIIVTS